MAKKAKNIVSTIILVILIAFVVILFIMRFSGVTPSLFGYQIFRVSSGSTEPVLAKGDVILVQKVPLSEINEGDIITYKSQEKKIKDRMVTHRVVAKPELTNGRYSFRTKGDVNGTELDPVVYGDQVQGRYVKKLPLIDKVYSFLFSPYGLIVFILIILLLFGFELISMIKSYRALGDANDNNPKKN